VALALSGCAVGPHYATPTPPAPSTPAFVSATPAATSADQPSPTWWRLYEDPAIDPLVREALVHNNNLLVAAGNLAEARGALALANAGRFPATTISAGAQYGVTADKQLADEIRGLGPASPGWLYTAGLDVSYEVDLFGRVRKTIQAAKADYEAQQAAEDVVRVSVAGETTRAYLNACAYGEELAVAQRALDTVTQTYEVTANQARDGGASQFDVVRAKEQVEQVRSNLPTYESQRRAALFQLAVLTGKPPEEISQAADACKALPKLTRVLPIGDIQSLFRRRPDVRQAERQLKAATARIGVATADLYPTVSLAGSGESAAATLGGLTRAGAQVYSLGPLLSWSFPNTLVAQAEIREARGTASAAYANFRATVLQALQDTETAVTAYANELDRNAALLAARDQSQLAFGLARSRYRDGSISYLDLMTAQADLVNANASLAGSDQALASDQVTLFKALGGGWEQAPAVTPLPIRDGRTGQDIKVK
jgi:NodT family efflux transporter outer membrane factor (OMF) lipoprotein